MARIRSIKPEFWVSEQIAECSTSARLTFVGLWNFCDDRGVHPAKPKTLKAELFPMDDITSAQVGQWVEELISAGLVRVFEASEDGDSYWHVTGWDRHQKIDRPSYKHPTPPAQDSTSPRRDMLDEDSTSARRAPPPGVDGSGVDRKGEESSSPKARTPAARKSKTSIPSDFTVSDRVKAWAVEKGFSDLEGHLESFKDKCAAKGYTNVDWDAAFMGAIRDDWAKLRPTGTAKARPILDADHRFGATG